MTKEEAAQIVRSAWPDTDGCGSCGWRSALYEHEPLEVFITQSEIDEGRVHFPCFSDDASESGGHRGFYVYLRDAHHVEASPNE
jgi:hypothetical protein